MNVLYDGNVYDWQAAGGINRYFANLIDGLPDDCFPTLTTYQIRDVNWPRNPRLKLLRPKLFRPYRVARKLQQHYFNWMIGSGKYHIFHPTYYSSLVKRSWDSYDCPIVVTVYDMIHEKFADIMDPTGKHREEKRQAVMAAQAVLCISEHTKRDLLECYAVPESKITVTYLAADLNVTQAHGPEPVPQRPYFLYVGSRAPYKNFAGLLEALSKIAETALCVVGPALIGEEQQQIADLGLSGRIEYYGYASDAQLAKLYRCSLAFVYPSLYEGFGIPPLEAMQCETPVVAANTSSLPEVVGEAGLLFDPQRPTDLPEILRALANGSIAREKFIARGHERARQFTWNKTVASTVEVYRSLAAPTLQQTSA